MKIYVEISLDHQHIIHQKPEITAIEFKKINLNKNPLKSKIKLQEKLKFPLKK